MAKGIYLLVVIGIPALVFWGITALFGDSWPVTIAAFVAMWLVMGWLKVFMWNRMRF